MPKHVTVGWEQFRLVDRSPANKYNWLYYLQTRQTLFGWLPITVWTTVSCGNFITSLDFIEKHANAKKERKANKMRTKIVELPSLKEMEQVKSVSREALHNQTYNGLYNASEKKA